GPRCRHRCQPAPSQPRSRQGRRVISRVLRPFDLSVVYLTTDAMPSETREKRRPARSVVASINPVEFSHGLQNIWNKISPLIDKGFFGAEVRCKNVRHRAAQQHQPQSLDIDLQYPGLPWAFEATRFAFCLRQHSRDM